ncbi:MAG TPA: cell division protein FtsA [Spirochaetota bacterium]|nr:cell division protein FtsA [Spirochaetota bacterium]HOL56653.1 cell division protein FtsA [Spirochaetota bacterium]HPP04198.1 cell division protein FtsA [Spirochaetota bacterium]
MRQKENDLIVAIDIGSSKISVAISEINDTGNISIIGIGKSDTKGGMRNGIIINIESVVKAINEAVEQAEIQAGREISSAIVGVSGNNVESLNSKGIVAISGNDKEIREFDITRVIEAAKAVAIPMDRQILHIIPQNFTVDGQEGIKYPVGMVGTRLECQIHIITTGISSIQNVVKSMDRTGLSISNVVLQNLANAKSILYEDEKELGVLLIDLGAETAKVTVYCEQAPFYNAIYSLGGCLITNDIIAGLKVPYATAEKIKVVYGVASFDYVSKDEVIEIPSVGGRIPKIVKRSDLVYIIRPRVEEIFEIIKEDLTRKGFIDKINGGVVLTGGTSLLTGITDVAQEIFETSARIGYPHKFSGLGDQISGPEYSVLNGLILWGYERFNRSNDIFSKSKKEEYKGGFLKKVKTILEGFF